MPKIVRRTREEVIRRWVAALRSGKYRQGRGQLRSDDGKRFCCLGVLCDLAVKDGGPEWEYRSGIPFFMEHQGRLHGAMEEFIFSESTTLSSAALIRMNDDQGLSFRKIADRIEKELLDSIQEK